MSKFAKYPSLLLIILCGCTTLQTTAKLEGGDNRLSTVCIVEHDNVREGVIEAINDVLVARGVEHRVIPGSYQRKGKIWYPTYSSEHAKGCDGMLSYVANWSWDLAVYMSYAKIWVYTPDAQTSLGSATYDVRANLDKFIDARAKVLELTDGLFAQYQPSVETHRLVNAMPSNTLATFQKDLKEAPTSISDKLRELSKLKKEGLITHKEFQVQKRKLFEGY